MDWSQVLTIVGANIALFGTLIGMLLYQDKKIEAHRLELQSLMAENRKEQQSAMLEHRKEMNEILREIKNEMREFHGRLCAIEERRLSEK